jgi:putative oxidoreductase
MLGVAFMDHGAQKLFGAFGGSGLDAFAKSLASAHVPAPMASAVASSATEFFGGLAIAVGALTRLALLPLIFNMIVAVHVTSGKGFSVMQGGVEYPLLCLVLFVALFLTGPGRWSLDGFMLHHRE